MVFDGGLDIRKLQSFSRIDANEKTMRPLGITFSEKDSLTQ